MAIPSQSPFLPTTSRSLSKMSTNPTLMRLCTRRSRPTNSPTSTISRGRTSLLSELNQRNSPRNVIEAGRGRRRAFVCGRGGGGLRERCRPCMLFCLFSCVPISLHYLVPLSTSTLSCPLVVCIFASYDESNGCLDRAVHEFVLFLYIY